MNADTAKPARKTKSKEPRVSCRAPRALIIRLERIARQNGMDVSDVVRMSLYQSLPRFEQKGVAA